MIGEELGLLGTLLVLGLFVIVGVATSRIVLRHPDPFVKITTAGIECWIVGQAFINIGVVIGLLPVIGVPLPLVSAGGFALIMTMAALGVLISFARSEPGAAEALAARGSVVRRSLAVVGRGGAPPRRPDRAMTSPAVAAAPAATPDPVGRPAPRTTDLRTTDKDAAPAAGKDDEVRDDDRFGGARRRRDGGAREPAPRGGGRAPGA